MLAGPLIAHLGVPSTTMAEQSVEGMTVNERLFHLGLHDQFDSSASQSMVSGVSVQVRGMESCWLNVKVTDAARFYRAASELTAGLGGS